MKIMIRRSLGLGLIAAGLYFLIAGEYFTGGALIVIGAVYRLWAMKNES